MPRHAANPIELAVDQHFQIFFCRAALQLLLSPFILMPCVTLSQVKNLVFGLVKVHPINHCSVIQFICVSLHHLSPLKRVNNTLRFGIIFKLANCAFKSSRSVINTLNLTYPRTELWGTPLVTSHQLDEAPFTTTLWALLFRLIVLAHFTVGQLVQKDAVRDRIKSINKTQKNHIHCLPFTLWAGDFITEGCQISVRGCSFCEATLTVPDDRTAF